MSNRNKRYQQGDERKEQDVVRKGEWWKEEESGENEIGANKQRITSEMGTRWRKVCEHWWLSKGSPCFHSQLKPTGKVPVSSPPQSWPTPRESACCFYSLSTQQAERKSSALLWSMLKSKGSVWWDYCSFQSQDKQNTWLQWNPVTLGSPSIATLTLEESRFVLLAQGTTQQGKSAAGSEQFWTPLLLSKIHSFSPMLIFFIHVFVHLSCLKSPRLNKEHSEFSSPEFLGIF